MPKITDYTAATSFDSGDVIIKDGTNGTKKMTVDNAAEGFFVKKMNATMRRNFYRGKNLGTSITAAQWAAISAGTFEDLYIGDYWTLGGKVYRIADMDYYINVGDTQFTTHHLVIVPDANMYNAKMNDTNTTEGGYTGSKMYTDNLATAISTIESAFGSAHVLTHRDYFTNAVTDGHPSGGAWFDSKVELMNEIMVYGCPIRQQMAYGGNVVTTTTTAKKQLALFRLDATKINTHEYYWLRDVVSSESFAGVDGYGGASGHGASYSDGVRPYFLIG